MRWNRSWFSGVAGGALLLLGAAPGIAQITGTDHDMSAQAWSGGQICIVCHTPHNAKAGYQPLWNHQVTGTAAFTLYNSATLNATIGQPASDSKLCLSCHDGTVALENFGTVTTGTTFIVGGKNVGTDLSNDHPISFAYNAALVTADGGLKDPATAGLPRFGAAKDQLECSTCHNVHSNANSPFLRLSNAASALCLKCHNK